jgi:hypothetical protein
MVMSKRSVFFKVRRSFAWLLNAEVIRDADQKVILLIPLQKRGCLGIFVEIMEQEDLIFMV